MSTPSLKKAQLLRALGEAVRRMGAQSTLFGNAVAAKVGLSPSDLECLDLIVMGGGITPGELATATGLTSGAITGVVNRLEAAGYARREPDPVDARKLRLQVQPHALATIAPHYQSMQTSTMALWSSYTAEQLSIVLNFIERSTEVAARELTRAQGGEAGLASRMPLRRKRPLGAEVQTVSKPTKTRRS